MFKEILAVLLLINMTMSAPNPEPQLDCEFVNGQTRCENKHECQWLWIPATGTWEEVCLGRKKREVDPDAREKREAKPDASPEPQDINVRCRQVCQGGECFELCSFG